MRWQDLACPTAPNAHFARKREFSKLSNLCEEARHRWQRWSGQLARLVFSDALANPTPRSRSPPSPKRKRPPGRRSILGGQIAFQYTR